MPCHAMPPCLLHNHCTDLHAGLHWAVPVTCQRPAQGAAFPTHPHHAADTVAVGPGWAHATQALCASYALRQGAPKSLNTRIQCTCTSFVPRQLPPSLVPLLTSLLPRPNAHIQLPTLMRSCDVPHALAAFGVPLLFFLAAALDDAGDAPPALAAATFFFASSLATSCVCVCVCVTLYVQHGA